MKIMYSPIDKMKATLEMIAPAEGYKGGTVSYEAAKEFYDFVLAYVDVLQNAVYSGLTFDDADDRLDKLHAFEEEHYIDHSN